MTLRKDFIKQTQIVQTIRKKYLIKNIKMKR